jgi:tetraacyldisaccharide 4'-kinase
VQLSPNAAEIFGDEPSLIAQKFPQIPVYVGPNKLQTCLEVEKAENPDIILVDDGFQHIRLHRDVDIVLIDVTEPRWHYLPLPSGYGRDALWQLDRAAIIVLTKENLSERGHRDFARALVSSHKNVIGMDYKLGDIHRISDDRIVQKEELFDQTVLLVSGIGRPKTFHALISTETRFKIVGHVEFKDHHAYAELDVQKVVKIAHELEAKFILVTEKDAIKLKSLVADKQEFLSVGLQTQVKGLEEALRKEGLL